eukprot:jgi/Bigna1/89898/estExt_fgenesh1_pg.C_570093
MRTWAAGRLPRVSRGMGATSAGLSVAAAVAAFGVQSAGKNLAVAEEKTNKMAYRMLGNSGLQVSVLAYGFWATFGDKNDLKGDSGVDMAKKCLRAARKGGVNLFDNAEGYGSGRAERIMGEDPALWRRSDILITTKIFWGGRGVNELGLSRKHIVEGLDAACKRLQTEYVDLVFCHRPDPLTPTETVVRAMTDAVRSGKATAWGTSEWSAQQITEAVWIARQYGLEPPMFEQPQYHMFWRERLETVQRWYPCWLETCLPIVQMACCPIGIMEKGGQDS